MARRQPQGRTPFKRKQRQAGFPDLSKKPFKPLLAGTPRTPSHGGRQNPVPAQQLDPIVGGRGRRFRARKPNRRVPTNPHDPKSKDPFARAGMAMGTNDTKIFKRAGMNMGGL